MAGSCRCASERGDASGRVRKGVNVASRARVFPRATQRQPRGRCFSVTLRLTGSRAAPPSAH
jgi:hypothetical protein